MPPGMPPSGGSPGNWPSMGMPPSGGSPGNWPSAGMSGGVPMSAVAPAGGSGRSPDSAKALRPVMIMMAMSRMLMMSFILYCLL